MRLSNVEEYYLKALKDAIRLPAILAEDGALIVYSRGSEPPAYTLYIATLHAGLRTRIASAVEASIHILPYKDVTSAIVLAINPKDPRVLNAAITASLLGVKTTLIAPPLHEAYEERAKANGVDIVKISSEYPLLTMSIAALRWSPKLMGFREERVRGEISGLETALKWVYESYGKVLREGVEYDVIAYTPSTKPGAYYYCRAVECGEPIPLEALPELPKKTRVLVLETSTEEYAYRDIILEARTSGINVEIVNLNTDPVTAAFYSILIALAITGKAL